MGMNLFRSSIGFYGENKQTREPNTREFKILNIQVIHNMTLTLIRYKNCNNFKGLKLLVFEDVNEERLLNADIIDPHFSEINPISPIARFKPDDSGLRNAIDFCHIMSK